MSGPGTAPTPTPTPTPARERWQRHTVKAVILLAAGCVCTALVALSGVAGRRMSPQLREWGTYVDLNSSAEWLFTPPEGMGAPVDGADDTSWAGVSVRHRSGYTSPGPGFAFQMDIRAGLPLYAFSGRLTHTGSRAQGRELDGLYVVGPTRLWGGEMGVPYHPIWPGFLFNMLFYAALSWGVWAGVGRMRAWRRRWAGRCGGCGYEAGPLPVCPECGAAP